VRWKVGFDLSQELGMDPSVGGDDPGIIGAVGVTVMVGDGSAGFGDQEYAGR
jgi:hypothetical protein